MHAREQAGISMTEGETYGPWKTAELLGEGSTGAVFLARSKDRVGALKLLRPPHMLHAQRLDEAWPAVERRLEQVAGIDSPHVVSIWEWGRDGGSMWMVMERLEGQPWTSRPPCSVDRATEVARQLALGLSQAHAKGVIHGDLKPANLFETPRGRTVLLDFALSFDVDHDDVAIGSPMWLAPESLAGRPMTQEADVYALGQCMAEILTGRPTFSLDARGPSRLLQLHALKQASDGIDPGPAAGELRELILDCTRREPYARPSAQAVVERLAPGGGGSTSS